MRKRILTFALSMAMILGLAWQPAYAAGGAQSGNKAYHYFYDQLGQGSQAQKIYDMLENAYKNHVLEDGNKDIQLTGMETAAAAYLKGNRSLFNDFAAAKDAFDLEHPEAWYFDSAQLSLTATGNTTSAEASMGTGKTDSYLVLGANKGDGVKKKTAALEAKVTEIVNDAKTKGGTYEAIKYVHDKVINSISYKYEFQCEGNDDANISKEESAGAIRTAYALVTGEGVCEGYVRSFQMILNELGIPCVPIHGTQTSDNDPQQHMWCAVYISDEKSTGWYVVDPTWDDPITESGTGGERDTYLMVGNDKIAANWIPSGYVSTGTKEFKYPDIAPRSYGAGEIMSDGLSVTFDKSVTEDIGSMVYRISYNGMGVYQAAQKEYHLLVKMYDINADGSANVFDDWYYATHGLLSMGDTYARDNFDPHKRPYGPFDPEHYGNAYYHDEEEYLVQIVSNCEYVEFAVTDIMPTWDSYEELFDKGGYFEKHGGKAENIIAQTGLICNPYGNYEQRPYVMNVSPDQTQSTYVGATHTIHMEFTDLLYHPNQDSINESAKLGKVNEAGEIVEKNEPVGLDYTGKNHSWGMNSGLPHSFTDRPEPKNVRWYCMKHETFHHSTSEINTDCRLSTLEFEFTPSVMWADDSVAYQFFVTGLVGVQSNKKPAREGMSFVFENASCATRYRCPCLGGIDWNLWGQPQLLDDPNNLIDQLEVSSTGSLDDSQTLAQMFYDDLADQRTKDPYDMNGRLLLVVEEPDKDQTATMADMLKDTENGPGVDLKDAIASALYEIDFARICGQTVVKTGDSLRMQVGFPAGFDAKNLSTTEFKVYHFIKDKDGNITKVEPIPVTVTPYGLVFVVNSFSPFAIVAETAPEDTSRSVVLVSGSHGKITSNYTLDKNEVAGSLKLKSGESYTVTITPDDSYEVESITVTGLAAGRQITFNSKTNSFVLSYDDIGASGAMIGVTFAEKAPEKVEVLSLCDHTNVKITGTAKAATCTEDGYNPGVTCITCGQIISVKEVIPATGHVYKQPENYKGPTCTETGEALTCTVCGKTTQAPALGHTFKGGICVYKCGTKEPCTVTFDPSGGMIVSGNAAVVEMGTGSTLKENSNLIPKIEKSGEKIVSWQTTDGTKTTTIDASTFMTIPDDPEKEDAKEFTIARSIILTAVWNKDTGGNTGGDNTGGGNTGGDNPGGDNTGAGNTGGGNTGGGSTGGGNIGGDNTGGGNTGGGNTGGGNIGGTTTKTETAADGTVTTTVTNSKTGKTTVTEKSPDGSVSVTETDASGNVSRQESFADGVKVSTKIPVGDSASASVSIPAGMTSASVTIHAPATAGTVAVNRATGEIVMLSVPVEGGLKVVLDSSADIVLVDLSQDFDDMPGSHWAADSVDFVTAHGLFNGMGGGKFSPDAHMTRTMLMTVLARFNGVDTDSGPTWDGPGMEWAVANGISDGTDPGADITREQLAVMLYRYAGSPAVESAEGGMSGYSDAGAISDWASTAMRWAVQKGIIQGSSGNLNPGSKALRSEVSAMIERFCRNVAAG